MAGEAGGWDAGGAIGNLTVTFGLRRGAETGFSRRKGGAAQGRGRKGAWDAAIIHCAGAFGCAFA